MGDGHRARSNRLTQPLGSTRVCWSDKRDQAYVVVPSPARPAPASQVDQSLFQVSFARSTRKSVVLFVLATSFALCVGVVVGVLAARTSGTRNQPGSMSAASLAELAPETIAVLRPDQLRVGANLYFLGDSVFASMDLDEYFPSRNAANRGVGRNTTGNMLQRLPGTVLSYEPSCVVVMGGVNDVSFGTAIDWMSHAAITEATLSSGANVILVTTPQPVDGELAAFVSDANRRAMNESIRALGTDGFPRVLIADFARITDEMSHDEFRGLTTDGYHLNSDGFRLLAQSIDPLVDDCLGADK